MWDETQPTLVKQPEPDFLSVTTIPHYTTNHRRAIAEKKKSHEDA